MKDRIVSISHPHVRPIVRGKGKARTEFGAKLSASVVDGFVFADRTSFDAHNGSEDLPGQIEAFRRRHIHYPASVHADRIYLQPGQPRPLQATRHSAFRPAAWASPQGNRSQQGGAGLEKQQLRQDEIDRIPIEGKFGQGKRRFGLGLIKTKQTGTTESSIHISFLWR